MFGILFGSSLAYYLKGSSAYATSIVAENMTDGSTDILKKMNEDERGRVLQNFLSDSYRVVFSSIIFDTLAIVVLILLLCLLLGAKGALGIYIGLSLIGTQIILLALTRGNAWKNASAYREHNRQHQKEDRNTNNALQGYVTSLSLDSIPGTPIFTYILFAIMYVLVISTVVPFNVDLAEQANVWDSI